MRILGHHPAGYAQYRVTMLPHETLTAWYRKMVEIRIAEDKVMELYMQGLVPGTLHLSQGQEAVAVGVLGAVGPDDWVGCTYRGHHHALTRGMSLETLFAEIMGRATGCCRGMGGSIHVTDFSLGLLGASAIIGAGIPVAVGAAMASKYREDGRITVTFFGDGACNIGMFHESLNMAAVWKAPVVFVIENNQYGEYTPYRQTTAVEDLADRALGVGMPGFVVDGQDAEALYEQASTAVERARRGDGPTLIEAKTYRYRGHSRTDPATYRPEGELEAWRARDPIDILGGRLEERGILSKAEQEAIREEKQVEVDEAGDRAAAAPWPTMEQAMDYVYAG